MAFQTGDLYHARHICSGLSSLANTTSGSQIDAEDGHTNCLFRKGNHLCGAWQVSWFGSSHTIPVNAPESDTLIKHQAVGGETLIPNNMPRSVLEFSGIAWVSRGHPDNGPAPPYHNVRFTPESVHAERQHRRPLSAISWHYARPRICLFRINPQSSSWDRRQSFQEPAAAGRRSSLGGR